jgi:hypothetical protein
VRPLEEDHGPALVAQLRERAAPLAGLARQEALEAEPVHGHTGDRQGHENRARPGHAGHRDPDPDRGAHQPVPGVRDRRHPGIRHKDDAVTLEEPVDELARPGRLVVLVVADRLATRLDLEVGGEPTQPSGVLSSQHVGPGQLVAEPR